MRIRICLPFAFNSKQIPFSTAYIGKIVMLYDIFLIVYFYNKYDITTFWKIRR